VASDHGASELIARAEKTAMWFIETADSVDFADLRWSAVLLFQTLSNERVFVGYMTLFSFLNPITGSKLRICQALVLPIFQGKGLARELMLHIYRTYLSGDGEVSDLTVEDPSPDFQRLRDAVDLEWFWETNSPEHDRHGLEPADVAKKLKIIKSQAEFVLEAWDYVNVVNGIVRKMIQNSELKVKKSHEKDASIQSSDLESDAKYGSFRLKVKRRLLKANPELKGLTKKEMQEELVRLYDDELQRFRSIEKVAFERLRILNARVIVTTE